MMSWINDPKALYVLAAYALAFLALAGICFFVSRDWRHTRRLYAYLQAKQKELSPTECQNVAMECQNKPMDVQNKPEACQPEGKGGHA